MISNVQKSLLLNVSIIILVKDAFVIHQQGNDLDADESHLTINDKFGKKVCMKQMLHSF